MSIPSMLVCWTTCIWSKSIIMPLLVLTWFMSHRHMTSILQVFCQTNYFFEAVCFDKNIPLRQSCIWSNKFCISDFVPYHIISYHIISYHIISYHIISYHIITTWIWCIGLYCIESWCLELSHTTMQHAIGFFSTRLHHVEHLYLYSIDYMRHFFWITFLEILSYYILL